MSRMECENIPTCGCFFCQAVRKNFAEQIIKTIRDVANLLPDEGKHEALAISHYIRSLLNSFESEDAEKHGK